MTALEIDRVLTNMIKDKLITIYRHYSIYFFYVIYFCVFFKNKFFTIFVNPVYRKDTMINTQ